ncbi:MAG TPA: MgtC/SapB family protein [Candidatus Competibacteraceae bacterium]|nr:MgtC/SapB family protein [Candidatus Competibacteraceae bacterium]
MLEAGQDVVGLELLQTFLISLGIGLFIGLERERTPSARAGLRTFGLVALLGTTLALLGEKIASPWLLAAGLLACGLMTVAANLSHRDAEDPGTTTVVAVLLCYGYGAMVWYGYRTLAVMLTILTTLLLYFKAELHGMVARLTPRDRISILQFAVLALIILPILPDRDLGPYGVLNPHQIWLMVVLISGISLAGYAALRIAGPSRGAPLLGLLGGLVSSTATTLVYARHAHAHATLERLALVVILTANLVVLLRLGVLTAVVAPAALPALLPLLGGGLLTGLGMGLWAWRSLREAAATPPLELANPVEIRAALGFGLVYSVVLFLSAWLSDYAGSRGLYAVALVSGLTDVDAITLSSLRLYGLGKLGAREAATAIGLAVLSNLGFKLGMVMTVAGGVLARQVALGFVLVALGLVLGWGALA